MISVLVLTSDHEDVTITGVSTLESNIIMVQVTLSELPAKI